MTALQTARRGAASPTKAAQINACVFSGIASLTPALSLSPKEPKDA
jgi:hypothetical protein